MSGARFSEPRVAPALRALAAVTLAYLAAQTLDGAALAAAFALEAAVLAAIAQRFDDELASFGALAFAGLTALYAFGDLASPAALIDGLPHPLAALGALPPSSPRWPAPHARRSRPSRV